MACFDAPSGHLGFRFSEQLRARECWSERCHPDASRGRTHGGIKAREIYRRGGWSSVATRHGRSRLARKTAKARRLGMRSLLTRSFAAVIAAALMMGGAGSALAAPKKDFKFAWSIYVGWMPWP